MFRKLISDFKPHKIGLKKVLGETEADIMKVVWKKNRATVRDVYEELRLEKSLAYTTVMTIMSRLFEKGLLEKQQQGNAFIYSPALSEPAFAKKVVSEVIDGLLDEFAEPAISHMFDKLTSDESRKLDKLEELIKDHKSKGE